MNDPILDSNYWHHGQLLAFSALDGPTDFDHGLVGRTRLAPHGIEITSPALLRIVFRDAPGGGMMFAGDFFRFRGTAGNVRGVMLDAHHLLIEGNVEVTGSDNHVVRYLAGENRLLVGSGASFKGEFLHADMDRAMEARADWLRCRKLPAQVSPLTRRTLLRAMSMVKGQVYSPEDKIRHHWTTPDRWPHKDMWLWDTAFHAIGWRHIEPSLAMEMIEGLFDLQRSDGFLTYRGNCHGPAAHLGDLLTQPPVLAYAVKLVHEKSGDRAWVERLLPRLSAYVEWDIRHRDTDGGGLAEWFMEEDETCRSGESGMDNSPRFDSARQIDAVDFNSYLACECAVLAEFYGWFGRHAEAEKWDQRHQDYHALLNERMWSEEERFYCDHDAEKGEVTPILSSAGFLPLYGNVATPERSAWLSKHLEDATMFATALPIASVAVKDQAHYAKDMWRGPVWMNMNWMIAEGLDKYGWHQQAQALRNATMREIERTFEKFGVFFEYFDDRRELEPPELLRKGENAPEKNIYRQVIHDFGWTATLYVDLVFRAHPDTDVEGKLTAHAIG